MLIQRANVYLTDPDAIQQAALVQWVGACRYVYNLGLEQRYEFGRGRRITYVSQARELTMLRDEVDWLKAAPVHALRTPCALSSTRFSGFSRVFAPFPSRARNS
jgi:putative transposase